MPHLLEAQQENQCREQSEREKKAGVMVTQRDTGAGGGQTILVFRD